VLPARCPYEWLRTGAQFNGSSDSSTILHARLFKPNTHNRLPTLERGEVEHIEQTTAPAHRALPSDAVRKKRCAPAHLRGACLTWQVVRCRATMEGKRPCAAREGSALMAGTRHESLASASSAPKLGYQRAHDRAAPLTALLQSCTRWVRRQQAASAQADQIWSSAGTGCRRYGRDTSSITTPAS
jgi:hypothetical protein